MVLALLANRRDFVGWCYWFGDVVRRCLMQKSLRTIACEAVLGPDSAARQMKQKLVVGDPVKIHAYTRNGCLCQLAVATI